MDKKAALSIVIDGGDDTVSAQRLQALLRAAIVGTNGEDIGWRNGENVTFMVSMTAELASALIERNARNRPVLPRVVRDHCQVMLDGGWLGHSPSPIAIDTCWRVINGQHRLHAYWLAAAQRPGLVIPMKVEINCDPNTVLVIDQNRPRTIADANAIAGNPLFVRFGKQVVAAVQNIRACAWGNSRLTGTRALYNINLWAEAFGEEIQWATHEVIPNKRLARSPVVAALMIIRRYTPEMAKRMLSVISGEWTVDQNTPLDVWRTLIIRCQDMWGAGSRPSRLTLMSAVLVCAKRQITQKALRGVNSRAGEVMAPADGTEWYVHMMLKDKALEHLMPT